MIAFRRALVGLLLAVGILGGASSGHAASPLSLGLDQSCAETLECKINFLCMEGRCQKFNRQARGGVCTFHRECQGQDKCVEGTCSSHSTWTASRARRPRRTPSPTPPRFSTPTPFDPNLRCVADSECASPQRCFYGHCVAPETWNQHQPPTP